MEEPHRAESPSRPSLPNADACLAAWRDLVDLGYELAFDNLRKLGKSPAEAVQTVQGWLDRDAAERFRALRRLGEPRNRHGE